MSRYTMILWARPKDIGIDDMADIAYKILVCLNNYGDEVSPKYTTAMKKSLAKNFVMDRNSTKALLEKCIDKTAFRLFNNYISQISFFSSMEEERSSGISISIGRCNPMFNNTLIVDLPERFSGLSERRKEFVVLFQQLIEIFNPYYGFVPCGNDERPDDGFWKNDKPTGVHWMNYYNESTAESIGLKRLASIKEVKRLGSGYFFMLQDEPLNIGNLRHVLRKKKATERLGF